MAGKLESPCLQALSSGANRDRTGDLLLAKQALSQLSYGPARFEFTAWTLMPLPWPQTFTACSKAGEEDSPSRVCPVLGPPEPGSGKSGTPWARMHLAKSRACRFCWAVIAGGGPPPPGRNSLQAACAFFSAGPLKLTPSTVNWSVDDITTPPGKPRPPEPWVGSGKLESPLARMHLDIA
jgi:hypothetical protein